MIKEGLNACTEDEDDLVPFNLSFPMDMLVEQTCFNLGVCVCKSSQFMY